MRLRFSIRLMMIVIAQTAILCAWGGFVAQTFGRPHLAIASVISLYPVSLVPVIHFSRANAADKEILGAALSISTPFAPLFAWLWIYYVEADSVGRRNVATTHMAILWVLGSLGWLMLIGGAILVCLKRGVIRPRTGVMVIVGLPISVLIAWLCYYDFSLDDASRQNAMKLHIFMLLASGALELLAVVLWRVDFRETGA